jgi:hypothetical protein
VNYVPAFDTALTFAARLRYDHDRPASNSANYPGDMVRLSCAKCGRVGQYRKQNLIGKYGADIRLPDLREEILQCERRGQMHHACMVHYVDLKPK